MLMKYGLRIVKHIQNFPERHRENIAWMLLHEGIMTGEERWCSVDSKRPEET